MREVRAPLLVAADVAVHYRIPRSGTSLAAVDGLTLDVMAGEFICIVGPSGCGKTTVLNAVDGLVPVSRGTLTLDGTPISGPGRDRAMVFQQPSLLPWRTVLDNVVYGLELARAHNRARRREIAMAHVRLVGLDGFEHAYPSQLSGGMQQRVNLARALATDPSMLLLDEPFASLDAQTREQMQLELMRIWLRSRKTAIFITHDVKEAIYLADRVIVLTRRPGRVRRIVDIDLPRPRPLTTKREPDFLRYEEEVWDLIQQEGAGVAASPVSVER